MTTLPVCVRAKSPYSTIHKMPDGAVVDYVDPNIYYHPVDCKPGTDGLQWYQIGFDRWLPANECREGE